MAFGMSTFTLLKFDITGLAKPYSATEKTMNTWNISGMFIVLWPITAKNTRKLATKPQSS